MHPMRFVCLIVFFISTLPGCASFLASQIATGGGSQITGNFDWTDETPVCDNSHHCVPVTRLRNNDSDSLTVTLNTDLKINQKQKFWYFSAVTDNQQIKPLANELIVLFAGYNQPAQILALHQQWLHVITGADVWVVPGAEQAERFSFGLDYVAPLISEISRQ